LLGSRYRFEIAPAAGGLSYTRVLADYRHYVMPVRPVSIAMRVLPSGRFGPDGNDPRLLSSFLGSQYLVRGHLQDLSRCQAALDRPCDDDLLGSRILVGNLELRFPIWGLLSRELKYGQYALRAAVRNRCPRTGSSSPTADWSGLAPTA